MYSSDTKYLGVEDCIVQIDLSSPVSNKEAKRTDSLLQSLSEKCDTGLDHAQNSLATIK